MTVLLSSSFSIVKEHTVAPNEPRDMRAKEHRRINIIGGVVIGGLRNIKRQAERMDHGTIVCLLADGGWKYLSTSLWTTDYEELAKRPKARSGGSG